MDFVTRRKDCSVTRIDISYLKIDMSSDPMLGGEMKRKANNMRTIPQIYVNNAHLGGFVEIFYAMQQFGKLEKLLKD
ncbi:MAG: glutaredoxin [Paracoccaceae bacterium]|tara:strand:- start:110 stop:340 length:231 start_codon:yes stop_codon:yes gene_type:complete